MITSTPSHPTQVDKGDYYRQITDQDIGEIARELLPGRITEDNGRVLLMNCPHHESKSKLSLKVDISNQLWNCWACKTGGNILHLVEFVQSRTVTKGQTGPMPDSHRRARDWLAARKGLPPLSSLNLSPEEIQRIEAERVEADQTFQALTAIAGLYHERLMGNSEALAWVEEHYAISRETIESLKIGYSDNSAGFTQILNRDPYGLTRQQIEATGTLVVTKTGKRLPFFDNRITFPYWYQGRVVYMIGRQTPWTPDNQHEHGKYKKLQTHNEKRPYVDRCINNRYLYNEDAVLMRPGEIIITEGVTDCIAGMERGLPVISPVTIHFAAKDFERIVPSLSRIEKVILCMDSETSGKGLEGALDTAKMLVEHKIDARIAILPRPEGTDKVDVNSFFKGGGTVDDFRAVLDKALSPIEYEISQLEQNPTTKPLKRILTDVARLEPVEQDRHLRAIADNTGIRLTPLRDQVRQLVKELKDKEKVRSARARQDRDDGGETVSHLTDKGNAQRLASLFGDNIRWCQELGGWLVYDGRRWIRDKSHAIQGYAKQVSGAIYEEAVQATDEDYRNELERFSLRCESARAIRDMISLLHDEPGISVDVAIFDTDPMLLNVENGTIDLPTQKIRPHDRENMITRLAPVEYDPSATCPRWEKFIDEIQDGDEELVAYLQRFVGSSLTGDTRDQTWVFFLGKGSNGKGVFVRVLRKVLGDYYADTSADMFIKQKHDHGPRPDLVRLRGARLVVAQEPREGYFNSERIKEMTGQDPITARDLYSSCLTFVPEWKIILCANNRPAVTDTTESFWRRLHLVPFDRQFLGEDKDDTLQAKLEAEAPGILNWAIAGCLEWQKTGLKPPEKIRQVVDDYREDADTLGGFIDDSCILHENAMVPVAKLYPEYVKHCEIEKTTPVKRYAFNEMMSGHRGVKRGLSGPNTKRVKTWLGIGLRSEQEDDSNVVHGKFGASCPDCDIPAEACPKPRRDRDSTTCEHFQSTT